MLHLSLSPTPDTSVEHSFTPQIIYCIIQVFEIAFKTRVLDLSQTSLELNQPRKYKIILVDAHQID
jgi:hypothetical protein